MKTKTVVAPKKAPMTSRDITRSFRRRKKLETGFNLELEREKTRDQVRDDDSESDNE